MSRLTDHDLYLRNGHAEPIRAWPVQAVRVRGHRRHTLSARLLDGLMAVAVVLGFVLIVLVAMAGVAVFVYVLPRLLGEVFGGR